MRVDKAVSPLPNGQLFDEAVSGLQGGDRPLSALVCGVGLSDQIAE